MSVDQNLDLTEGLSADSSICGIIVCTVGLLMLYIVSSRIVKCLSNFSELWREFSRLVNDCKYLDCHLGT